MSKNKLYTCSYFCKRLVESGFDVNRLNINYENDDLRKWTIIVNKQNSKYKMNIFITCFKDNITKEFGFKFQGQRKTEFFLNTLSMKIILDILDKTSLNIETINNEDNIPNLNDKEELKGNDKNE